MKGKITEVEYTVQKGDSLYNIAKLFYGNGWLYRKIAEANSIHLTAPIYPGQTLVIPMTSKEENI